MSLLTRYRERRTWRKWRIAWDRIVKHAMTPETARLYSPMTSKCPYRIIRAGNGHIIALRRYDVYTFGADKRRTSYVTNGPKITSSWNVATLHTVTLPDTARDAWGYVIACEQPNIDALLRMTQCGDSYTYEHRGDYLAAIARHFRERDSGTQFA